MPVRRVVARLPPALVPRTEGPLKSVGMLLDEVPDCVWRDAFAQVTRL